MKVMQIVADGTPGGGTTNVLALAEDLLAAWVEVAFCSEAHSYAVISAKKLDCGTFLFAGHWEGMPIAPVEAMALGQAMLVAMSKAAPMSYGRMSMAESFDAMIRQTSSQDYDV